MVFSVRVQREGNDVQQQTIPAEQAVTYHVMSAIITRHVIANVKTFTFLGLNTVFSFTSS